jgi:hypothetical protein
MEPASVTTDHQQIRRDFLQGLKALALEVPESVWDDFNAKSLALLDELEQAEKWSTPGRGNELVSERDSLIARLQEAEARLAKVPALVEALTNIAATDGWYGPDGKHSSWSHWRDQARAALAAWEQTP